MIIGKTPIYLVRYPIGDDNLDIDIVCKIIDKIQKHIEDRDPTAELIALPQQMDFDKISLSELKRINNYLSDYIAYAESDVEEEIEIEENT